MLSRAVHNVQQASRGGERLGVAQASVIRACRATNIREERQSGPDSALRVPGLIANAPYDPRAGAATVPPNTRPNLQVSVVSRATIGKNHSLQGVFVCLQ